MVTQMPVDTFLCVFFLNFVYFSPFFTFVVEKHVKMLKNMILTSERLLVKIQNSHENWSYFNNFRKIYWPFDRSCYSLLEQGPCQSPNEWLILDEIEQPGNI